MKRLPAVRVAALTGLAAGFEPAAVGPVIRPLYDELFARLRRAGLAATGPAVAWYEDGPDGEGVLVHAGVPVDAPAGGGHDVPVVGLPEVEQAATIVHRGSMDGVMATIQALARWIDANGYRSLGYDRELYLEPCRDRDAWVTELQEPVTRG